MEHNKNRGILILIFIIGAIAVGIFAGLVYFLRKDPAEIARKAASAGEIAESAFYEDEIELSSGTASASGAELEEYSAASGESDSALSQSEQEADENTSLAMNSAEEALIKMTVLMEIQPALNRVITQNQSSVSSGSSSGQIKGNVQESGQAQPSAGDTTAEAEVTDISRTESTQSAVGTDMPTAEPNMEVAGSTDSVVSGAVQAETSAAETAPPVSAEPGFDCAAQLLRSRTDGTFWEECPTRDVELLTPNEYSRPQIAIDTVNNLVIHYVGNAGSTAMQNRNYFESLKDTRDRSASSHFVIGLDGEIVQCIPLSEIAYATKWRNSDTISIECCHPDADGKFNEYTYGSLVRLCAFLCKQFHLDPQGILRHYDVTEKLCPLYYVEHPDAWQQLKDDIEARLYEIQGA